MKVYLDNCCFNRPFDNQKFIRINLETQAKLYIQERILKSEIELVWSYILEYENSLNPFEFRRKAIEAWKELAVTVINEEQQVLDIAKELQDSKSMKSKDALHLACAIVSGCDYFITTDDIIIKKLKNFDRIKVKTPVEFVIYGV